MKCVQLLCSMKGHKQGAVVRCTEEEARQMVVNDYAIWATKESWKLSGRAYL